MEDQAKVIDVRPSLSDQIRWKVRGMKYRLRSEAQRLAFWLLRQTTKDCNSVRHAEFELRKAGWFDGDGFYGPMMGEAALQLVTAFSAQGHSGMSAGIAAGLFAKLSKYDVLTPLSSDPDEWNEVSASMGGEPCWQNRRKSSCFSDDGGKTWYDNDGCCWIVETEGGARWRRSSKHSLDLEEGEKLVRGPVCDGCNRAPTCEWKKQCDAELATIKSAEGVANNAEARVQGNPQN